MNQLPSQPSSSPLNIDGAQRLYIQVADQITAKIASGAFKSGQRLPSERALSEQFQVSRPTLREALIALEVMGQISIKPGSGLYVLPSAARANPWSAWKTSRSL